MKFKCKNKPLFGLTMIWWLLAENAKLYKKSRDINNPLAKLLHTLLSKFTKRYFVRKKLIIFSIKLLATFKAAKNLDFYHASIKIKSYKSFNDGIDSIYYQDQLKLSMHVINIFHLFNLQKCLILILKNLSLKSSQRKALIFLVNNLILFTKLSHLVTEILITKKFHYY